jgi:hypothetical protein
MTLIITEINEFGIVMVADSALTQTVVVRPGVTRRRILQGVQKLQVVPNLCAGISMWGRATTKGNMPVDVWLKEFINENERKGINSLEIFANDLAQELQQIVGDVSDPMGFHLAGFVKQNGTNVPVAYHIRNCETSDGKNYTFHEFIPGLDIPPAPMLPGNSAYIRNGDYLPFAILSSLSPFTLQQIKVLTDMEIPYPSLVGRMKYLSAWVKFVSDLYESAERDRTIGGSIATLMIWSDGKIVHQPAR